jgi:hypothetical protein
MAAKGRLRPPDFAGRLSAAIVLHYRLAEGRRTLLEAEKTVVDPNYLANPDLYFTPTDPLRLEKAMLGRGSRRGLQFRQLM